VAEPPDDARAVALAEELGAEHHSGTAASTPLGREDRDLFGA
jgi:hypothetical protein